MQNEYGPKNSKKQRVWANPTTKCCIFRRTLRIVNLRLISTVGLVAIVLNPNLFGGSDNAELARERNTEGFRLYKKKQYREAVKLFNDAMDLDSKNATAHYNTACAMVLFNETAHSDVMVKGAAETDPDSGECLNCYKSQLIRQEINFSLELEPGRRARALTDPDFKSVGDEPWFQWLVKFNSGNNGDIKQYLASFDWRTCPESSGDRPMNESEVIWDADFDFSTNGHIHINEQVNYPKKGRQDYNGRFRLENNQISATLDKPFQSRAVLKMKIVQDLDSDNYGKLDLDVGGKFLCGSQHKPSHNQK
jgi:hypothetical protein